MEILKSIKEEIKISKQARNIIFGCLILGLFTFLSIFWKWFALIAFVFSVIFVFLDKTGKSVYYLFFLLPLIYIFRTNYDKMYFISYLTLIIELFLVIKLFKVVKDKNKKINLLTSIFLFIFIIYIFVVSLKNGNYRDMLSFGLGIVLLYLISYFYDEIDIKELAFVLLFGMVFSVIIGLFKGNNLRLQSIIDTYYIDGYERFSACYINTNTFSLELMLTFSIFTALYLTKRINIIYYPVLIFSTTLLIFAMGKTAFIIWLINILADVVLIIKKINKHSLIKGLLLLVSLAVSILPNYHRAELLVRRFFEPTQISKENNKVDNKEDYNIEENDIIKNEELLEQETYEKENHNGLFLSKITTGRSEIWISYLKNLAKNPQILIFGAGFGYKKIGEFYGFNGWGAHNIFIEMIYTFGIIGVFIFILFLLSILNLKKNKISFGFIFMTTIILLYGMVESFLGYRLSNYILFAILLLTKKRERLITEESKKLVKYENLLAILTPAYDRAELLKRTYKSLIEQSNKNIVWYIVDDGSTDNTEQVVEDFIKQNKNKKDFKIVYIKKENGGKHTALNTGLKEVKEDYVIILDSDDHFTKDAVETILQDIQLIDDKDEFCGLGYLRLKDNGEVIGVKYTQDGVVDTFINQRYNKNTYGDKAEVFKTEILKQFPFPEFENEKFVSESVVWCAMSGKYKMVFFNKGIYVCEYQEGGLSDGVHKRLFKNPKGASACYRQFSTKDFCFKLRVKYTIAYIVYSIEAGITLKEMKQKHFHNKFLISLLYIPAKIYHKKLKRRYE